MEKACSLRECRKYLKCLKEFRLKYKVPVTPKKEKVKIMGYSKAMLEVSVLSIIGSVHNAAMAKEYLKAAGLPSACTRAAELCFTRMVKESRETDILRKALKDLNNDGSFHFY